MSNMYGLVKLYLQKKQNTAAVYVANPEEKAADESGASSSVEKAGETLAEYGGGAARRDDRARGSRRRHSFEEGSQQPRDAEIEEDDLRQLHRRGSSSRGLTRGHSSDSIRDMVASTAGGATSSAAHGTAGGPVVSRWSRVKHNLSDLLHRRHHHHI